MCEEIARMEILLQGYGYVLLVLALLYTVGGFFYLTGYAGFGLVNGQKRAKYPPGPPKLPLFGNIHQIVGRERHHILRDLARKYGPLMHLKIGEISTIVVSSSRLAKEVTTTHDVAFADRFQVVVIQTMLEGIDIGHAPFGAYWKQIRKISLEQLLSKKNVLSSHSIREEAVNDLVASMRISAGSVVNFSHQVSSMTNSIIWTAAVGKSTNNEAVRELFARLTREFLLLLGGIEVVDLFPSLKFLHPFSRTKSRVMRIKEEMSKIIDNVINEHMETRATEDKSAEESLLDVLFRLQQTNTLEVPITGPMIKLLIMDLFIDATDTPAMTIEWVLSELIRHPSVMEKAVAEVRNAFKGKKKVQQVDIQGLKYLKLVIKETLRLHPPAPLLLPKFSREECEIDGYIIPAKTQLIINVWALGRDPKHWDDPEMFKPERFEGSSVDFMGNNHHYLPFGAGRRMCPAMPYGLAVVETALAHLLYCFSFRLPYGMNVGDLDMTGTRGTAYKKSKDLFVVATPR